MWLHVQGVGKSCLIHRYVKGHFDKDSKITIGAAFLSHTVNLRDEGTVKPVKFEIWDTAGEFSGFGDAMGAFAQAEVLESWTEGWGRSRLDRPLLRWQCGAGVGG